MVKELEARGHKQVYWMEQDDQESGSNGQAPVRHSKPRFVKVHSKALAEQYQRLGWTMASQFQAPGGCEPYEYLLECWHEGEPPRLANG